MGGIYKYLRVKCGACHWHLSEYLSLRSRRALLRVVPVALFATNFKLVKLELGLLDQTRSRKRSLLRLSSICILKLVRFLVRLDPSFLTYSGRLTSHLSYSYLSAIPSLFLRLSFGFCVFSVSQAMSLNSKTTR